MFDLPHNRDVLHAFGGVHGGVYCIMLDNAAWFTAAARRPLKSVLVTSSLTVHFLAPARGVALRAVGRMVKAGKAQDVVEARLLSAETGALVGYATGTFVPIPTEPTWQAYETYRAEALTRRATARL